MADDLSQRTWQAVWDAVQSGRYEPQRAAMTTFVYAVAQNIWRQWAKRAGRTAGLTFPDEPGETGLGNSEPDPASVIARAELIDAIRSCLSGQCLGAGLSPDQVGLLQLLSRGLSDRELAEQLGVAPSTANARKQAVLDKLRAYLEKTEMAAERRAVKGEQQAG